MRVYIAAPIFNDGQREVVDEIDKLCKKHGHMVFSPYKNSQGIFNGRKPADCLPQERAQVLTDNIAYLEWCDILLAWVGGYEGGFTDPGVVWELGYCSGRNGAPAAFGNKLRRPFQLAFIHDQDRRQAMNLMLSGTVDAVAKGLGQLNVALHMLTWPDSLRDVVTKFHPDHQLAADKVPEV